MRLAELFPDVSLSTNPEVTGLCEDTRTLRAGDVFFAHVGSKDNGLAYASDAVTKGAVAVVIPSGATVSDVSVPVVRVTNTRTALAHAAARMYPNSPPVILAVTGTSGKTSTTYFLQQFLNAMDVRAVSVGTLGLCGAVTRDGSLTTPTAVDLHQTLHDLAGQGVRAVALEASSQAIDQDRIAALDFTAAAFTNLSQDHLDYHGTMENYFAAKARLFTEILPENAPSVVNIDDPWGKKLISMLRDLGRPVVTVGQDLAADIRFTSPVLLPHGQKVDVVIGSTLHQFTTSIMGLFQIYNILTALALGQAAHLNVDEMVAIIPTLAPPPGRLQPVPGHPRGAAVYIDYAHKPDALQNVLQTLRAHNPRRLWVVFGCGGDRDAGKRAVMGGIAARLATDIIVTDDNPRSENPAAIRAAIMAGCPAATEISDRRAAIRAAITQAGTDDIVLIAGKGHEQGQKFHDRTEPFSDYDEALAAIAALAPLTPAGEPA